MLLDCGSVIEALLGLWPHQPAFATGLEELITSMIVFGFTLRLTAAASRAPKEYQSGTFLSAFIVQLAAVPSLGGAIALGTRLRGRFLRARLFDAHRDHRRVPELLGAAGGDSPVGDDIRGLVAVRRSDVDCGGPSTSSG